MYSLGIPRLRGRWAACVLAWLLCGAAAAQPVPALPPEVQAALAAARLPPEALAVVVADADAPRKPPRLAWRAQVPMNPASVMKLVTTFAALEQLGPAYTWQTPVYLEGALQGGTLQGNVYIQGRGDPKLVVERLWLLLRRLQAQGVQAIAGDIVLDRSAFSPGAHDPAAFDGEPSRPYNVAPDALLVNYQAIVLTFVPDSAAGVARVSYEPPLAGMQLQASVPLAAPGTACGDWRQGLRAELGEATRIAFAGVFPAACGERAWAVAPAQPAAFG
ncbi:MAG: D-alanyl-D-alanine carboxypeptidase, partial [Comamonadaceae bacterium]|nr:D-alanyl-D-alanine carboxypeptidase [Comamonadaceae bacterium]